MSDETIGIPGRREWDRLCRESDDAEIFSAIEQINSATVVLEDYLHDDATRKDAYAAMTSIEEALKQLGKYI